MTFLKRREKRSEYKSIVATFQVLFAFLHVLNPNDI